MSQNTITRWGRPTDRTRTIHVVTAQLHIETPTKEGAIMRADELLHDALRVGVDGVLYAYAITDVNPLSYEEEGD